VILAGGDGSYMAGLSALRAAYASEPLPAIALAPGGTVSTVARNHGMHGPRARYATAIVEAAVRGGVTEQAPSLHLTDSTGADRIGFIFGAGLVARFFDRYEAEGARGYAGAARIVARIFASSFVGGRTAREVLSPAPALLTLDGVVAPATGYSLVCAAAVRNLGLSMRVTYRAGAVDGRVHLVASPLGPRALGPQMPLVLLGKRLRGASHVDALVTEATLDQHRDDAPYVLDGDLLRAQKVTLRAGPTLRLIRA
jgi:diacylglycerol kinase family enzyme